MKDRFTVITGIGRVQVLEVLKVGTLGSIEDYVCVGTDIRIFQSERDKGSETAVLRLTRLGFFEVVEPGSGYYNDLAHATLDNQIELRITLQVDRDGGILGASWLNSEMGETGPVATEVSKGMNF